MKCFEQRHNVVFLHVKLSYVTTLTIMHYRSGIHMLVRLCIGVQRRASKIEMYTKNWKIYMFRKIVNSKFTHNIFRVNYYTNILVNT